METVLLLFTLFHVQIWKAGADAASWHRVFPDPMNYCPQSPLSYDCERYQNQIWNYPSLASAPITQFSDDIPRLLVFLPGTGSTPDQFRKGLLGSWRSHGKAHVLGQSYVSAPYPVSDMNMLCGDSSTNGGDSVAECLSRFHSTVAYGDSALFPSSLFWGLSASDAIEQRILTSLRKLHQLEPLEGWNGFYTESQNNISTLIWNRIIISGHSQGKFNYLHACQQKEMQCILLLFETFCGF
jgi:hypothetical protein